VKIEKNKGFIPGGCTQLNIVGPNSAYATAIKEKRFSPLRLAPFSHAYSNALHSIIAGLTGTIKNTTSEKIYQEF